MFKLYILLALAVAAVSAQQSQPAGGEAAPEPYSYGYEADSHSASEQRDPSGKVTGFYTLVDADGRQRRVDYIADEGGFRAKVQTNELGTKSENSADVEVLASPPSEAQLAPVAPTVQQVSRNVQVTATPARGSAISYVQQPAGYGYSSQYGYSSYPAGYGYSQYGYNSQPFGYGYTANYAGAPSGYGYGYTSAPGVTYGYTSGPAATGYGYTTGSVGNYNNHLPSQYYRSVQTSSSGVSGAPGAGVRYVQSSGVVPSGTYQNQGSYRSYSSSSSSSSLPATGSSNYLVLKKREAEQKKN